MRADLLPGQPHLPLRRRHAGGHRHPLCAIPGFITATGYDDSHEHGQTVQPWLRLGVNDEVVLLDLRQVQEVHHTLADWLARVRQQP